MLQIAKTYRKNTQHCETIKFVLKIFNNLCTVSIKRNCTFVDIIVTITKLNCYEKFRSYLEFVFLKFIYFFFCFFFFNFKKRP